MSKGRLPMETALCFSTTLMGEPSPQCLGLGRNGADLGIKATIWTWYFCFPWIFTIFAIMFNKEKIKLLAFDADDTLWDCQGYFDDVEAAYAQILSPYGSREEVSARLFATETANLPVTGYGTKAFTLSLVENAIAISDARIPATDIMRILQLGLSLLELPGDPLPGVEDTLLKLRHSGKYGMVVFTKGELLDQQNKLHRSGLRPLFDDIVVVADKTEPEYQRLCERAGVGIGELLMVGNSFKSDISPVLGMGGYAAYIPHNMWQQEHIEEYDHDHLLRLDAFNALTKYLL